MRRNIQLQALSLVLLGSLLFSCSPQKENYHEIETSPALISKIKLKPGHTLLAADGKAQIDLTPMIYVRSGINELLLPPERVKDEWLEYSSSSGEKLSRRYSTSDKQLIGKTIDVKVKIKNTDMQSNTATFDIVAPAESNQWQEATFPVVFHVVQMKREVESLGIHYEKAFFDNILDKFNNVFSGQASLNPTRCDTHLRFKPALFNPDGDRLFEAGVNRVVMDTVRMDSTFLENELKKQVWDPRRYLNIWLLSDINSNAPDFDTQTSVLCTPESMYANASKPVPGLVLTVYQGIDKLRPLALGVVYRLQLLNNLSRTYERVTWRKGNNDLIHYLGYYFGLLPTEEYGLNNQPEDYCADTQKYFSGGDFYIENKTIFKETDRCFFVSENIMDDPTGLHISITKEQAKRIRWVIENCPERTAWKSDFAFTGR